MDASTGHEMTYRSYIDQIERVANGLQGLGVTKGTVIADLSSNILLTPVVIFAILKLGAVILPATPTMETGKFYDEGIQPFW